MNDFADRDLTTIFPTTGLLDVAALAALARELAMDINELPTILARFGLTEEQLAALKQNRTFKKLLDGAVQAWTAASNTPERIRIEAGAAFEQVMPVITKRLQEEREGLDDVVKGARLLADVAGLGVSPAGMGGERVTINIDLGSDTLTLTHEVKAIEPKPTDIEVITQAAAALPSG